MKEMKEMKSNPIRKDKTTYGNIINSLKQVLKKRTLLISLLILFD
jgi:hypothetical protein